MAMKEEFIYDDRYFEVEALEKGGRWKGRFILYSCVDQTRQERTFELDDSYDTSSDALNAARRAAIELAA